MLAMDRVSNGIHVSIQSSVRWFKDTQTSHVIRADGTVYEWFHGFITRRRCEDLLQGTPDGTFLVRISDRRYGYHLSARCGVE